MIDGLIHCLTDTSYTPGGEPAPKIIVFQRVGFHSRVRFFL